MGGREIGREWEAGERVPAGGRGSKMQKEQEAAGISRNGRQQKQEAEGAGGSGNGRQWEKVAA